MESEDGYASAGSASSSVDFDLRALTCTEEEMDRFLGPRPPRQNLPPLSRDQLPPGVVASLGAASAAPALPGLDALVQPFVEGPVQAVPTTVLFAGGSDNFILASGAGGLAGALAEGAALANPTAGTVIDTDGQADALQATMLAEAAALAASADLPLPADPAFPPPAAETSEGELLAPLIPPPSMAAHPPDTASDASSASDADQPPLDDFAAASADESTTEGDVAAALVAEAGQLAEEEAAAGLAPGAGAASPPPLLPSPPPFSPLAFGSASASFGDEEAQPLLQPAERRPAGAAREGQRADSPPSRARPLNQAADRLRRRGNISFNRGSLGRAAGFYTQAIAQEPGQ